MNYFAHARIAALHDGNAAFVLGAMLPDFAHMLGERSLSLDHEDLRAGVRHHHRCDAAFHGSTIFRDLLLEAIARLDAEGVARGPARGAAHVGVELLFDGALVGDPPADAVYLRALERAPTFASEIRWRDAPTTLRWQLLHSRLRLNGLPYALRDPLRVTERVARALEPRPRLRLAPHERRIVQRWLGETRGRIERVAPALVAQTVERLAQLPEPFASSSRA